MKMLISTAVSLTLLTFGPGHAEPTQFGAGTKIGRVADLPKLTPSMQRTYNRFKNEAKYFAAFSVNFETGDAFYIQNFHELNRVKVAALEGCRQISGSDGCTLYAVALPKDLPTTQSDAKGLSLLAQNDFKTVYMKYRKPGKYAAFAISGASHHGYANAYDTKADAEDTAISYCQVGVAKDMAELGPQARKFARARGWQNCRIVDLQQAPAD